MSRGQSTIPSIWSTKKMADRKKEGQLLRLSSDRWSQVSTRPEIFALRDISATGGVVLPQQRRKWDGTRRCRPAEEHLLSVLTWPMWPIVTSPSRLASTIAIITMTSFCAPKLTAHQSSNWQ